MNSSCIFAKPFKPMVYIPTKIIFEANGINPFEKPFEPMKKEIT